MVFGAGRDFSSITSTNSRPVRHPRRTGLPQRPALLQQTIEMLRAVERERQAWRSRTNQAQGIVKMQPGKGLQAYEVGVESVVVQRRIRGLRCPLACAARHSSLACLANACARLAAIPKRSHPLCTVARSARSAKSPGAAGEEIHKVLRHIVALVEEVAHHDGFARVHVVAEDARRAAHD